MLLTDVAFGIMAKFAPQMNILTVSFPIKISVGLFMAGMAMGVFVIACRSFISGLAQIMRTFMVMMGGT
jgi:flagellar biosynthetic protein FliR